MMPTPQLRPLGIGERVDAGIKLYRSSFRRLAPALAAVAVVVAVIDALMAWWRADLILNLGGFATRNVLTNQITVHWNVLDRVLGSLAITAIIGFIIAAPPKAIAYRLYADAYLDRTATASEVRTAGLQRSGSVLWIIVLIDLVYLAGWGVLLGLGLAANSAHGLGVLVGLAGLVFAIFAIWWAIAVRLAVPSLMLEGHRGRAALRRSLQLVKGSWWSVFWTMVLVGLLYLVAYLVFNLLGDLVANVAVSSSHVGAHAFTVGFVSELLQLFVFVPFLCAVSTVVAVDMRVRKEGLDLALLAAGAARAEGSAPPPPGPTPPPPPAGGAPDWPLPPPTSAPPGSPT